MSFASNRFTSLLCAVGAGALLAACPDSGESPDARIPTEFDANTGPTIDASIDAGGADAAIISGTIAVLDVKVTNDLAAFGIAGLSGAAVSISYNDPALDEGTVTFPATGIPAPVPGGCTVRVYDQALGETPPANIGDGVVNIASGADPAPPLSPSVGDCAFVAAAGSYLCPAGGAAAPIGTIVANNGNGTSTYTFPVGTTLPADPVGRGVQFAGFGVAANNTPAGSLFLVAAAPAANVWVVTNPTGAAETTTAAGTVALFSGVGPTPAQRDFLADGAVVVFTKAAGLTPAVARTLTAAGHGLTLATDSVDPEAMPLTSGIIKASCATAQGGNCGSAGAGGAQGLILTGRTTNGVISAAQPPFVMPAPLATGKIATFTCTFIGASATMEAAAWDAVLATNPTRIETRILRVSAVPAGAGDTSVIAGHGLVGYTTLP